VSNTFTQEWEMETYYKMAETWGYRVFSVIVENRHGGVNQHGVPEDKLEIMKNRFEIKL
jgi:phenolic acid decarboxylase